MRLWIGLCFPHLSLDVFRPTWLADAIGAHAVLDANRVVAMTRGAREAGVQPGMRRAAVGAIAPQVVLTERDEAREREALQAVALTLLRFSPQVAHLPSAALVLDITASLRLFGGLRALWRRLRADIRQLGLSARLGLAPTASGAWLLACQAVVPQARRRCVTQATLARCLDALSMTLLAQAAPFLAWLDGIGCRTLGDLRRLPRAGLKRRCGPALLDELDRAYGEAPEVFVWADIPLTFSARLELPDRVEHSDALLFAGTRLLLQMTGWLAVQHKAVARFVLWLEHERGRAASTPHAVEVALAEASWDPAHLTRLLKERLGRTVLAAPVIAVRLEVPEVQAMQQVSDTLFVDPGGKPGDGARLVELLSARLGPENVLQFALLPDHRPEVSNVWVPAGLALPRKPQRLPAPAELPLRPFWLLDPPLALITRHHRPFYGSPLRLLGKPERVEGGWFDDRMVARDYFVGVASDASRYWVYRERSSGAAQQEVRWFLHGLFA